MDVCTQDTRRVQYTRLCIQVPIDQPLPTTIFIGNHHQRILFQSINLLCYYCGRIGHSNMNCAHKKPYTTTPATNKQHSPITLPLLHTLHRPLQHHWKWWTFATLGQQLLKQTEQYKPRLQIIIPTTPPHFHPQSQLEPNHGPWMLVQYTKN